MELWRLIIDSKNSASYNMAADSYLLELAEEGDRPPIIRLYGWDRPSITIGYHQKIERAVDKSRLNGTPLVRRITGGRALYHDDRELTYAVSGNFMNYPQLGHDLHTSYRRIADAIVLFYNHAFGWRADIARRDDPVGLGRSAERQRGCFSAVSRHEIVIAGRKVAAGSQRRTRRALMQHGAVKLSAPVFHPAIVESPQLFGAETIEEKMPARAELERKLVEAFEKIFDIQLKPQPFLKVEKEAIESRLILFKNFC